MLIAVLVGREGVEELVVQGWITHGNRRTNQERVCNDGDEPDGTEPDHQLAVAESLWPLPLPGSNKNRVMKELARSVAGKVQIPKSTRVTELGLIQWQNSVLRSVHPKALPPAVDLSLMDLGKSLSPCPSWDIWVKALQETVLEPDSGIPANPDYWVSNSVAQTLNNLVSMQASCTLPRG